MPATTVSEHAQSRALGDGSSAWPGRGQRLPVHVQVPADRGRTGSSPGGAPRTRGPPGSSPRPLGPPTGPEPAGSGTGTGQEIIIKAENIYCRSGGSTLNILSTIYSR